MALPTFQAAGTLTGSTAAISPPWPTHAVDDIGLLFVETANQIPTALTTANGFALVGTLSYGGGVAGTGADAAALDVYWCRATSTSMAAPTVADAGQHTIGRILTFRGCIATGNPWDVTAGDASGSASTSVTIPGVTTTVADCLVVLACSWADDSASGSLATITNASLANITSRVDAGNTSGNGGGFAVLTGEKATAGVVSASTGTLALGVASYQGRACIALKPPAAAGSVGTSDGVATASAVGASLAASAGTVAGIATAAATGASLAAAAGTSAGIATASAVGGALVASASTAAGIGAASGAGSSLAASSSTAAGVATVTGVGSYTGTAPTPTVTTTPTLRALLIANIAAIDALGPPGFRAYRHDQAVSFTDWCDANPAGAFRRYSVRDYGFDTLESVNQADLEWRRVQLRITVAYPHTYRYGRAGAIDRDALMRVDRHAIEVATGLRAYVSLETLPAVYLSSRANRAIGTACDFLVIDAVYGFFATPV